MNTTIVKVSCYLSIFLISAVKADHASWMEENQGRLENTTLESLSVPASHDAAMYMHDPDLIEIAIEDLHFHVEAFDQVLIELESTTGVLLGGQFLPLLDGLMDVVNPFDEICLEVQDVDIYCFGTGIPGAIVNWVDHYYEIAKGKPGALSITQNLSIYGQLAAGIRMFDLRPKMLNGKLYAHHSAPNVNKGEKVNWSYDLRFYVPCVERILLPGCRIGTDEWYDFGTFAFKAGGEIKSFSATGPKFENVLLDIAGFMQEGHKELIVLDITHYWKGINGNEFGAAEFTALTTLIDQYLSPWMITSAMFPAEGLAEATMGELLKQHGRVIVNVATNDEYAFASPETGFWDAGTSLFNSGGSSSDMDDLSEMTEDQRAKWQSESGSRFELWWTLTCPAGSLDCSVRALASEANPELEDFVDSLTVPNINGNYINEIWVDFSDETTATDIAIRMNPWSIPVEAILPNGRFPSGNGWINRAKPEHIRIVVYSDDDLQFDAMQLDLATVLLGVGRAQALAGQIVDYNRDGLPDLIMTFSAVNAGITCDDSSVRLTGQMVTGQHVAGSAALRKIPPGVEKKASGQGATEQINTNSQCGPLRAR